MGAARGNHHLLRDCTAERADSQLGREWQSGRAAGDVHAGAAARLPGGVVDQGADVSRVGGRAILRARALWNRDTVREADAVSAAGVPGGCTADRSRSSRYQPGGMAAVLLEQRVAGENCRL